MEWGSPKMKTDNKQELTYRQSIYRYTSGFIAALSLVVLAYVATTGAWFDRTGLAVFIIALAVIQLIIQLVVFLHIGREGGKLTMWSVIYGFVMALIIIGGSIWIMANMNYNMHMSPEQMHEFMIEQNKKGF